MPYSRWQLFKNHLLWTWSFYNKVSGSNASQLLIKFLIDVIILVINGKDISIETESRDVIHVFSSRYSNHDCAVSVEPRPLFLWTATGEEEKHKWRNDWKGRKMRKRRNENKEEGETCKESESSGDERGGEAEGKLGSWRRSFGWFVFGNERFPWLTK